MDKRILKIEEALNYIKDRGAFLTSGDMKKANTMTISWADMGYMCRKNIVIIVISDIRYTKEFIDKNNTFTISIPFDESMKEALDICGHNSGRDVNKTEKANINYKISQTVESPIIDGCDIYYECRVVLKQKTDLNEVNSELKLSDEEKYHTIYYGEILAQH